MIKEKIDGDELSSTITDGELRHYHINLIEDDDMNLLLKAGIRENVEELYHRIPN